MSQYASVHANPQGAGDARPTAAQIIRDESLEGELRGKVIVITGATSGIGLETARALATTGANLFLTVRDTTKAEATLGSLLDSNPSRISLVEMDNGSLSSVRAAAAIILEKSNRQINILVNNAGVMGLEKLTFTVDGHEVHFATNHLSHFLLFKLLQSALLSSSTPAFQSRVVMVASSAHRACTLGASDEYNFPKGGYNHGIAYAKSKLANVYMANELERRYGDKGLHATSLHPGAINSNISRNLGPEAVEQILSNEAVVKILKSPEQGAATTVLAAIGSAWEGTGGKYLEDCAEASRGVDDHNVFGTGYVLQTYDPEAEHRLWEDSLKILGLEPDA
ncbi:hypothetical protein LTR84_001333 [Exophiala bonariae]|uniref:WW domain-containing oxidoreductase n=1 Tax=Exophiala bonariae TaxID=1690606 RepID=A0AAV9NCA5_9EURO|nr:hypothetical protein LTR84_001333 [Exophiala bonariae]